MLALIPLLLSCAATVHPDTIRDIAWVESRLNPYAVGVVGGKGLMPKTHQSALDGIKQLDAEGKSYSVGLMQIHKSNFSKYGVTAKELLDPCTNLSVFEKVLVDCYTRGKTLPRALSCYYSGNFETGKKKEADFGGTSYVQRMGYVADSRYTVPSTKVDKEKGRALKPLSEGEKKKANTALRTLYPENLLKNTSVSVEKRPVKILRMD